MTRQKTIFGLLALCLAGLAIAVFFSMRPTSEPIRRDLVTVPSGEAQRTAPAPRQRTDGALVRFHSPSFGPANAPVTIVEFIDPSCEACRAFYPYVKELLEDYPDSVRLVLRYTLFHRGSEEVARILETARQQDIYQPVLEAVLAAQPAWHDDPEVAAAWEAASGAGLDVEQARANMNSASINAVLQTDMDDAKAVGIRGTPTFFVNGTELRKLGPGPLRELVDQALQKVAE